MRDEGRGLHLLGEEAFVAVFGAQAPLGIDHAALALDDLRIERQVGEPIGFEVEHQVERGARNPVLVHGDVVAGERVVGAALRFHEPVELAGRALRGAVEHHVLEEMREAGDARHFVAAADAHPVVERDVGDVAIGPDDDLHAVGQRRRLHLVESGHARGRRGLGGRDRGGAQRHQHASAERSKNGKLRHAAPRRGVRTLYGSRKRKSAANGGSRLRRRRSEHRGRVVRSPC